MEEPKKSESWWEIVKFTLITVAIIVPIRMFVAQPFIVSGSSMSPTFEQNQYLIVDEISYLLRDPKRGEVIIFRYPEDPSKFFIKRVIGLPGEKVSVKAGRVSVIETTGNIVKLTEPYVVHPRFDTESLQLKEGEYFVMGDNRAVSSDSRYWGPVARELVKGRVFVRLLPITKIGIMPGSYHYETNQTK